MNVTDVGLVNWKAVGLPRPEAAVISVYCPAVKLLLGLNVAIVIVLLPAGVLIVAAPVVVSLSTSVLPPLTPRSKLKAVGEAVVPAVVNTPPIANVPALESPDILKFDPAASVDVALAPVLAIELPVVGFGERAWRRWPR